MPKPGDTFRYVGEESLGSDVEVRLNMHPQTTVTVRELVDAGTPGAHTDSEDSVVVEWEQPEVGYVDGEPVIVKAVRATSIAADDFGAIFEAVA